MHVGQDVVGALCGRGGRHGADEKVEGRRERNPKGPEGPEGGRAPAANRGYLQRRPRFAVRHRLEGPETRFAVPPGALGHPGEVLAGESLRLLR